MLKDYATDLYAPVANMVTIRMLISVANQYNMFVRQLNVGNAFVNSEIDQCVFMKLPDGFRTNKNKVCRFNKAIYGLNSDSKLGNKYFDTFMQELKCSRSEVDTCLYVRIKDN